MSLLITPPSVDNVSVNYPEREEKKLVLNWSNIRNYKCWRRSLKKQDCRWPESWTWAIWGSSHTLHPWNVLYTWLFPAKTQPWGDNVLLGTPVENTWMVYVTEPSEHLHINFLKIWWMAVEIYLSCGCSKTSFLCEFPCLLYLPPTNLEWYAFFLSLFLSSIFGGSFANQQQSKQR